MPKSLQKYRDNELVTLRGDGTEKLEEWDRVYEYCYYNHKSNSLVEIIFNVE